MRIDDIDAAIEMLLDSFLQSQKASIRKQLERKFEKYRNKKADSGQLLLFILRNSMKNRAAFTKQAQGMDDSERIQVRLPITEFENAARDYPRQQCLAFYKSADFVNEYRLVDADTFIETKQMI